MSALALGFCGLLLFWMAPLGIILGLGGMIAGLIGLIRTRGGPTRSGLLVGGTLLSLIAVILNLVILLGWPHNAGSFVF